MEGVRFASINYASSQASVEYNPVLVSLADIRKKIADIGHSVLSESAQTGAQDIEARSWGTCSLSALLSQFRQCCSAIRKVLGLFRLQVLPWPRARCQ
jgi:hypothetical protein